jgi:hypothetical protein
MSIRIFIPTLLYIYYGLLDPVRSIIRVLYKAFENKGKSIHTIYNSTVISQKVYILCMVVILVFNSFKQKLNDEPKMGQNM